MANLKSKPIQLTAIDGTPHDAAPYSPEMLLELPGFIRRERLKIFIQSVQEMRAVGAPAMSDGEFVSTCARLTHSPITEQDHAETTTRLPWLYYCLCLGLRENDPTIAGERDLRRLFGEGVFEVMMAWRAASGSPLVVVGTEQEGGGNAPENPPDSSPEQSSPAGK